MTQHRLWTNVTVATRMARKTKGWALLVPKGVPSREAPGPLRGWSRGISLALDRGTGSFRIVRVWETAVVSRHDTRVCLYFWQTVSTRKKKLGRARQRGEPRPQSGKPDERLCFRKRKWRPKLFDGGSAATLYARAGRLVRLRGPNRGRDSRRVMNSNNL